MTANSDTSRFPPVEFDSTLVDLLRADLTDSDEEIETLCVIKPNSDPQYGTAVPFSNKYIIHSAQVSNGDDLAHLQLEICSYLLAFWAGPINLIFVACEGETSDDTLSREVMDKNAKTSYSVISEKQRPRVKTYANVEDCVRNHDGSKIRWAFAMDFAERLPYLFHPEVVYKLNSKRWLGDVPKPKSAHDDLLDGNIQCPKHQVKTREHKEMWYYGGSDCHKCTAGVEAEIARITNTLKREPVPFVLKLTQSLSAVGTELVDDEDKKEALIPKIADYLSKYLPRITKDNAHLYTTSLVLSNFIPGDTMALNAYIRRDGTPIFLGACNQLATGESGRQATAITFADQDELQPKYQKSLEVIGKALHEEGYYGPVGADIMQDKDGIQYCIDLNVRAPLSIVLYLLRSHFKKHGLGMTLIYECVFLTIPRKDFEDKFSEELEEARIIILGCTRLGEGGSFAYGMMIAGEDKPAVDELSDRILKFEA